MSSVFIQQFGLTIDAFLDRFDGSPNEHFGHIIQGLDRYFRDENPDLVIVVGDVNSTLAAAIVANRLSITIAHLESGLRSDDREMPEEINRILTDEITDYFFITEDSGFENLKKKGVPESKLLFVGNTMIDTLVHFRGQIQDSMILEEKGIEGKNYCLITIHRPSNVDTREDATKVLEFLQNLSKELHIVLPLHHRTRMKFETFGLLDSLEAIENSTICEALDYFSFQKLIAHSELVITDSGGIQEETTFLQVPCITLRENTERPVTITEGTNTLMDFDGERILKIVQERDYKQGSVPKLWDGHATDRIIEHLSKILAEK